MFNPSEVKAITVQQLVEWRNAGTPFKLIDVREPDEYRAGHLGGELIPLGTVTQRYQDFESDVPVVVQCRSGQRSANAILQLQTYYGYENLYNLKGGIMAYSAEIGPPQVGS